MAGGRRISRGVSSKQNLVYPTTPIPDDRYIVYEMKHIRIPPLPRESALVFELILCLHAALFTGLQFVHLYRTVWWLPQSFTSSGVNFYMIDLKVLGFITAVLGRRLPYLMLKSVTPEFSHGILQFALTAQMITWTFITSFHLWTENTSYLHLLYLFMPIILYIYVYGFSSHHLWEIEELDSPASSVSFHICSNEGTRVREQVETLRTQFNDRMGKMIMVATVTSYYSSFIPWCFAQSHVYYDLWWVSQHLVFSWLITFSLLLSRSFCPDFSDAFHKVASHLGTWARLRPNHIPSQLWIGETVFAPGSIVKHQRELYKAEGMLCVASEPGNPIHQRFQILFSGSSFARLLLGFHVSLIFLGMLVLMRTTEWYQVVSISSILTTSLYTFIRLGRDYLTLLKIYDAEKIIWTHTNNVTPN